VQPGSEATACMSVSASQAVCGSSSSS
jgi:hypothetical protein